LALNLERIEGWRLFEVRKICPKECGCARARVRDYPPRGGVDVEMHDVVCEFQEGCVEFEEVLAQDL